MVVAHLTDQPRKTYLCKLVCCVLIETWTETFQSVFERAISKWLADPTDVRHNYFCEHNICKPYVFDMLS